MESKKSENEVKADQQSVVMLGTDYFNRDHHCLNYGQDFANISKSKMKMVAKILDSDDSRDGQSPNHKNSQHLNIESAIPCDEFSENEDSQDSFAKIDIKNAMPAKPQQNNHFQINKTDINK